MDEYTLKLTFDNPVVPEEFLVEYNRDIYVLPTHLLTDIAPEDLVTSDFWQNPVGSGPCQFVSEVSGSTLVLSANKDYQLGAPGFDTPDHHRDGQGKPPHRPHRRGPGLLHLRRKHLGREPPRGGAGRLHRGGGRCPAPSMN